MQLMNYPFKSILVFYWLPLSEPDCKWVNLKYLNKIQAPWSQNTDHKIQQGKASKIPRWFPKSVVSRSLFCEEGEVEEDRYLRKGLCRCMYHFQRNTTDSYCKSVWCTVIWTTGHSFLVRCKPTQHESKENTTWKEDRKLDVWQIHAFPYIIDHRSRIMSIKKRTKAC